MQFSVGLKIFCYRWGKGGGGGGGRDQNMFARPGLARLLGYGYGVINNEFIIYIAYSPQVTAFRFSETHQLLYDPLRSDFMSVVLVVRSV